MIQWKVVVIAQMPNFVVSIGLVIVGSEILSARIGPMLANIVVG